MSPRKKITDADRALFLDAVAGAKPLRQMAAHTPAVPKKPRWHVYEPVRLAHSLEIADVKPMRSEEIVEFARNGISPRTLTQMRRRTITPTATLDLHGMRAKSAQIALHEFLPACRAHGDRCVRIIHGKGRGAVDSPSVLKSIVNQWLRDQASVLAFCSAPPNDGGAGAMYVLLKRPDE